MANQVKGKDTEVTVNDASMLNNALNTLNARIADALRGVIPGLMAL